MLGLVARRVQPYQDGVNQDGEIFLALFDKLNALVLGVGVLNLAFNQEAARLVSKNIPLVVIFQFPIVDNFLELEKFHPKLLAQIVVLH